MCQGIEHSLEYIIERMSVPMRVKKDRLFNVEVSQTDKGIKLFIPFESIDWENLEPSSTGKSYTVASTNGSHKIDVPNGLPVRVILNCYVKTEDYLKYVSDKKNLKETREFMNEEQDNNNKIDLTELGLNKEQFKALMAMMLQQLNK